MADFKLTLLVLLVLLLNQSTRVWTQTGPTFCTYADNHYTCDYASMGSGNRPIDFTGFSQQPQILEVNVNGYFPFFGDAQTFSSTFNNMNPSTFDSNYPGLLTVDCKWGGTLYLASGAFYNMSYIQHLKIKNCNVLNIPASVFAEIGELDYFDFEGGLIDTVDPNAMGGLLVKKLTTATNQIPRFFGHFGVVNSKFSSKVIPPGLLYTWSDLESATFKGTGIESITADVFRYNTNLRYIDLSDNDFTTFPSGSFDTLTKLSEFTAYNIAWSCTCADLWFIPYATANNVTLFGDFMCSNAAGQTLAKYYYSSCVTTDVCDGAAGLAMGDKCIPAIGMTAICMGFISFGVNIAVIVLGCLIKNQLNDMQDDDAVVELNNNVGAGTTSPAPPAGKKAVAPADIRKAGNQIRR